MLLTKLHIPASGKNLVHRSRLFNKLDEGLKRKLILVSAPAGFGKTSLLCYWIHQNKIPTGWYSLDKGDNDPVDFLSYIILGIQQIHKDIGTKVLELLRLPNKTNYEPIIGLLINELLTIEDDFLLVIDDYHLISNNEISKILAYLLEHSPGNMHIALLTRSDPSLPLARIRSQNQLIEIRLSDLSFSANDISVLFNKKLKINLSIDDALSLETKTEGWIAGLQLTALSLQDREDTSGFIQNLKGDNRYIMDYLIEEVLKIQSDDVKEFLLQTSLLEQISAPLCNSVLNRNDSQEVLEKLERNNMFVIPLDSSRKWFRYHHLFAELLTHNLQQRVEIDITALHNRASEWYKGNAMPAMAIKHAIKAGDYKKGLLLLEEIVGEMWENGQHSAILNYGENLPDELIMEHPEFCLYYAWILTVSGDTNKAEPLLKSAEQIIKHQIENEALPGELQIHAKKLLGKISVAFAYLYSVSGPTDNILAYCNTAMQTLGKEDLLWYSWAWFSNGNAKLALEDYMGSVEDLYKALEYGKGSGNVYLMSTITIRLSFVLHRMGQYKKAFKISNDLLSILQDRGYSQITKLDLTYASLYSTMAMMQFMWFDLDAAYENIKTAYELSNDIPNVQVRYIVLFAYSMVLKGREDLAGSLEKVHEMDDLLLNHKITPQQRSTYTAWKGYLLIELEEFEKAQALFNVNGQSLDQEITYSNEHSYVAYLNLLLKQYKTKEAEVLLQKLYALAQAGKRMERLHELNIFYAVFHNIKGNLKEAVQCLIEAMSFAAPNDIVMYFILYYKSIDDLLKETFKVLATSNTDVPKEFISKLKSAIEKHIKLKNNATASDLSERELETLKLIAEEMTNQEVADKLFISLNTVKTHLKNINIKLNVDSRIKAVAKAKELGML